MAKFVSSAELRHSGFVSTAPVCYKGGLARENGRIARNKRRSTEERMKNRKVLSLTEG